MTEDEAKALIIERFGAERAARVEAFLDIVVAENERQNLIAPSTVDTIWVRHGLDSAQLMFHVKHPLQAWLDIGTGGGFPGIVVALLHEGPVTMVEPRRKRAEFLERCIADLGIASARVLTSKVERIAGQYEIISARAVASVEKLLQAAAPCATPETRWILPRGTIEPHDLAHWRQDRTRMFHVEHSITDPESTILIVEGSRGPGR